MSYIGRGLQSGAFRQLDDISSGFDGSDTTHTMQVNSTNVTVGDVNQILLSLGGVIQKPGTDFTVSSSTLTFTTAPAANTSFFAVLLGSDNGGTTTPTDKSVTVGKIDINGGELFLDADDDTSITADTDDQIDIKTGGTDRVTVTNGNVAITAASGTVLSLGNVTASATATPVEIDFGGTYSSTAGANPMLNLWNNGASGAFMGIGVSSNQLDYMTSATTYDHVFYGNSQSSPTELMRVHGDGLITKPLLPAFRAKAASDQDNMSNGATIVFGTEVFDQGSNFASNTFTAPVTGKYQLSFVIYIEDLDDGAAYSYITLNTSNQLYYHILDPAADQSAPQSYYTFAMSVLADMDIGDTAHLTYHQTGGSNTSDSTTNSHFTGFLVC